ncbi:chorismate synthase [Lapidilactobacillus wuchangensis]|uniref:chorismate synthase n=1 Tax=Lapidilactobacillus wuchangensis TaxID=2486001 RepID=UPI000F7B984F|nr:chorismate synthase [Lapidilactobacillus wuchangensis]
MLNYVTAGESHGPYLSAIISDFPAQVPLSQERLLADLQQRQRGYGRGGRMKIETDQVQITSGVRYGVTLGSPIGLLLANRDFANWQEVMSVWPTATNDADQRSSAARRKRTVTQPRPGHADLVGALKYGHHDLRNVLERASARETTMRVAVGSLCQQFLRQFDIEVLGLVTSLGTATLPTADLKAVAANQSIADFQKWQQLVEQSDLRTVNTQTATEMKATIDQAQQARTTLGGQFCVVVQGLPSGLGSYTNATEKLDARLAAALTSINAIKGVSFGDGFGLSSMPGRATLDEIIADPDQGLTRNHNHQGGLEGGMTNGQPLIIHGVMKPIPTQPIGGSTVDLTTGQATHATVERSDVTAVPAAAVIAQSMVAITIMQAFCEMFGSDSLPRIKRHYQDYLQELHERTTNY